MPLSRLRRCIALASPSASSFIPLLAIGTLLSGLPLITCAKSASDYYVSSLPGAPEGPLLKMHAGHIEVTPEHHGNLFFWHFQNRHIANKPRTVIWLNGGPGCSSEDGALMEIGPYRVRDGQQLQYANGSWDEFANLLFVDNPVGTGYSFVDTDSYIHELQTMADQFVVFLEKWFDLFPEYLSNDLFIAGESFAGQHIPYIAKTILDRNKSGDKTKFNLQGLLIGNGWISPDEQYMAYAPYAYKAGLIEKDSNEAKRLESKALSCKEALDAGGRGHVETSGCDSILHEILRASQKDHRCVNMYDVRLDDEYPSCGMNWPLDLEYVTPYLRNMKVQEALHIDPNHRTGWSECNGAVSSNFKAKNSKPAIGLLPGLLEKIPVLLFSGEKDLICNHMGTEAFIANMEFNDGTGFETTPGITAPRRAWTFEGEAAGFWQEARNLTYVLFHNSSHMVPFDYPRRARDMLDRFMGVDIESIGGEPVDSQIDGEKGPLTSVGASQNSTKAEEEDAKKLQEAKWHAYYRSGEVALVVVVIAVCVWAWWIWRERRLRAGYKGLFGGNRRQGWMNGNNERGRGRGGPLEGLRGEDGSSQDIEAADFDENELDDLRPAKSGAGTRQNGQSGRVADKPRYSLGSDLSSDSDGEIKEKGEGANGHAGR